MLFLPPLPNRERFWYPPMGPPRPISSAHPSNASSDSQSAGAKWPELDGRGIARAMGPAAEGGRARRGRSYLRIPAPPPIFSPSVSGLFSPVAAGILGYCLNYITTRPSRLSSTTTPHDKNFLSSPLPSSHTTPLILFLFFIFLSSVITRGHQSFDSSGIS